VEAACPLESLVLAGALAAGEACCGDGLDGGEALEPGWLAGGE
jgi:hypothetical protein